MSNNNNNKIFQQNKAPTKIIHFHMYKTPLRHGGMHKWLNLNLTHVVVSKGRGSIG